MSQDQDSVDHELGNQEFGKSSDLPKVTDFGAGYRTFNLAEDNMTEALIEEEKLFQEKIGKDPLIGQVLDYFSFLAENPSREITSKSEFTALKSLIE